MLSRRAVLKLSLAAGIAAVPVVQTYRPRPDDTIVLTYRDHLTDQQVAYLTDILQRVFPGHRVCVVEGGGELSLVRPDAQEGV